jgi:hypothetical protein
MEIPGRTLSTRLCKAGEEITLRPKSFEVLAYLVESHAGQWCAALLAVWPIQPKQNLAYEQITNLTDWAVSPGLFRPKSRDSLLHRDSL